MITNKLIKGILAGMSIALAGTFYLSVDNPVIGGVLFSLGLLTICIFGWDLYTGKCCYWIDNPKQNTLILVTSFFGNFIGTYLTALLLRLSGLEIVDKVISIVEHKYSNSYPQTFILAIFCGILMSIAVLGYTKQKDDFGKFIIILLPITCFIIAKFEHVIANMYYLSLANNWTVESFIFLAICAIGNLIGCSLIPFTNILLKNK